MLIDFKFKLRIDCVPLSRDLEGALQKFCFIELFLNVIGHLVSLSLLYSETSTLWICNIKHAWSIPELFNKIQPGAKNKQNRAVGKP